MDVSTVTTTDRSLLRAVRGTLDGADRALLCVAFVQQRGVHLVEKELRALADRRAETRLVVTTTFDTTDQNLAWDELRSRGTLSNRTLLGDLRVHRSSAVCAILARLPQVERVPGREIVLRWR